MLLFLAPIGQISIDFYSTSLPSIANDLHVSNEYTQMIITGYLISYGFGQILYGTLIDVFGRKNILLITLPIYIISTLLVPFFANINMIIFMRFIQGLSISATSVAVKSIATDLYKGQQLIKVISMMALLWGISPILAPLAGGYIQMFFGWKACFYFLGITTLLIYINVLYFIKETKQNSIKLNIQEITKNYIVIFKSIYFWKQIIIINASIICLLTFITQTPYLLQNYYKLTPVENGYIALIASIMFLIGTQCSKKILNVQQNNIFAVNLQLISLFILSSILIISSYRNTDTITVFLLNSGIMMMISGILFPISLSNCLQFFNKQAGTVSGLIGFITLLTPAFVFLMIALLNINPFIIFPIVMFFLSIFTFFAFNLFHKLDIKADLYG